MRAVGRELLLSIECINMRFTDVMIFPFLCHCSFTFSLFVFALRPSPLSCIHCLSHRYTLLLHCLCHYSPFLFGSFFFRFISRPTFSSYHTFHLCYILHITFICLFLGC